MPIQYCRHIKMSGERCSAPALARKIFCYFHSELERRHRHSCSQTRSRNFLSLHNGFEPDPLFANTALELNLPPLEDRHSIQIALSLVVAALAEGRVDQKLATLLFYGLQVASSNAHKLNPAPKRSLGKVSLTVLDDSNGNLIAPEGDPEDPEETADYERPGSATRYWNMLQAEDKEKQRLHAEAIKDSDK